MVSSDFAQIMSLHAGEAYAMQNLTRTDRLGLLLSGKVSIVTSYCLHLPLYFIGVSELCTKLGYRIVLHVVTALPRDCGSILSRGNVCVPCNVQHGSFREVRVQ
jgi:hypothetical protein